MEKKEGGQPHNRNRANGDYNGMMVRLSGPNYDAARKRLDAQGKVNPTGKEVVQEMNNAKLDWSIFKFMAEQFPTDPEGIARLEKEEAEKDLLCEYRADYRWIKACETMEIELLREIIANGPYVSNEDGSQPKPEEVDESFRELHPRRHRQAVIVLEARERGYDPLAPTVC